VSVKIHPEPHHEPVGLSAELYPLSSRWIATGVAILVVLGAAIAAAILV